MHEVIIIGSGLAGLSAAIQCAAQGRKAVIISDQPSWCAQSVLAAGGINAALNHGKDGDSISQHEEDTWEAGCHLADREAIHRLAMNASDVIGFLEDCGVIFSRNENGDIAQRYFGGQKKKRTCYSNANIGKQLVSGLEQRTRLYEDKSLIRLLNHHIFLDFIKENDSIGGVFLCDRYTGELLILEGPVIAASGGIGGLFGRTTGSLHSDGSVTAAAYQAGVQMANLEMIQYHPTTILTKSKHMLISEAARGEGGRLFAYQNGQKWYFCEEWYGERGNLMPRDVLSRAIDRVLHSGEADSAQNVWLDLTHLGQEKIEKDLAEIRTLCMDYLGLDPVTEPIPVVPGIHYFMGGIWVDINHRTSMKGLYAAGECCSQYHGANRLGGNSTLGAVYGGRCAADSCCKDDTEGHHQIIHDTEKQEQIKSTMIQKLAGFLPVEDQALMKREQLQTIMRTSMGILRDEEGLLAGRKQLSEFMKEQDMRTTNQRLAIEMTEKDEHDLMSIYSYKTELLSRLGDAMLQSAIMRKESRGAHYRLDYPDLDQRYEAPTLIVNTEEGEKICTN